MCREVKVLSEKIRERASWFSDPFSRQVWSALSLQLNFIALLSVWITRSSFPRSLLGRAFFKFFLIENKQKHFIRVSSNLWITPYGGFQDQSFTFYTFFFKRHEWKGKVQLNAHFSFCRLRKAVGYEIVLREIQRCFLHCAAQMPCFEIQQRQRRFFHSMVKKITFYELYM